MTNILRWLFILGWIAMGSIDAHRGRPLRIVTIDFAIAACVAFTLKENRPLL
jgi:hypothetical protein